ncbi:hypothetical protein DFH07DRAFT_424426 [Mycena maculata]|uniref:F-box domain-containing protein n=1 Tax=Mycena maculata TaxID=230809 RepID=A0AAD7JCU9_9AGAR|nr:hypothetical protein DFH07DRAFT_424426 [Mycena maculata]
MSSPIAVTTRAYPPPEIWRLILQFATWSDTSFRVDYQPFQHIQELQETAQSERSETLRLQTCLSLMGVSRCFRDMTAEFMYEDVRIHDTQGLKGLLSALARSAREDGPHNYGSYVRRLELPQRRTIMLPPSEFLPLPTHPIPCSPDTIRLADILHLCPNLEILVRPCLILDAQNVIFWAGLVGKAFDGSLPHLKRLEWYETELDERFYGTNHIDRLREIVARSPNLRYLFLTSDRPNPLAKLSLPSSLRTIRLNRSYLPSPHSRKCLVRARHRSDAPNLQNLVLHTMLPTTLLDFLAAVGHQLRVLELAFAPQMVFSSNQVQRLISRCPKLEELVYYLGAPEISPLIDFQCDTVKRVRIKLNPDEWNPCRPVVRSQVDILTGPSFPALEEVILHDRAQWFLRKDSRSEYLRRLQRRGCAVNYEDGSPVIPPS